MGARAEQWVMYLWGLGRHGGQGREGWESRTDAVRDEQQGSGDRDTGHTLSSSDREVRALPSRFLRSRQSTEAGWVPCYTWKLVAPEAEISSLTERHHGLSLRSLRRPSPLTSSLRTFLDTRIIPPGLPPSGTRPTSSGRCRHRNGRTWYPCPGDGAGAGPLRGWRIRRPSGERPSEGRLGRQEQLRLQGWPRGDSTAS